MGSEGGKGKMTWVGNVGDAEEEGGRVATYRRRLDRGRGDLGERKMRSGGLFRRRRVGLLPFWLFAWLWCCG